WSGSALTVSSESATPPPAMGAVEAGDVATCGSTPAAECILGSSWTGA
ncbi:MAG: hypothetical protein AVDCRST_MAG61-1517, partial [uncultured Friedmanniella sp.]